MFEFVPVLNEIFDTKIPVEHWKMNGETLIGTMKVDEQTFIIHIHPLTYKVGEKTLHGANLAFYALVDGKEIEQLTFNNQIGSKILGAISNALVDKVGDYDLDFVLLIAKNESDKRIRIYRQLASFKVKSLGFKMLDSMKTKKGESVIILVKKDIDQDEIKSYVEMHPDLWRI